MSKFLRNKKTKRTQKQTNKVNNYSKRDRFRQTLDHLMSLHQPISDQDNLVCELKSMEDVANLKRAVTSLVALDLSASMGAPLRDLGTGYEVSRGVLESLLASKIIVGSTPCTVFGFYDTHRETRIATVDDVMRTQGRPEFYGATYTESLAENIPSSIQHIKSGEPLRLILIGDGQFTDDFATTVQKLYSKEPRLKTDLVYITLILIAPRSTLQQQLCHSLAELICESDTAATIQAHPIHHPSDVKMLQVGQNITQTLPKGCIPLGHYYTRCSSPQKVASTLKQLPERERVLILVTIGEKVIEMGRHNPSVLTKNPIYAFHWQILKIMKSELVSETLTVEQAFISKLPKGNDRFRLLSKKRPPCGQLLGAERKLSARYVKLVPDSSQYKLLDMESVFIPGDGSELNVVLDTVFRTNATWKTIPYDASPCLPVLSKEDFKDFQLYAESHGHVVDTNFTFSNYLKKFWTCLFSLFGHMFHSPDQKGIQV